MTIREIGSENWSCFMNRVKVFLFANLREMAGGAKFIELDLPAGATVQMLKEQIAREYPALEASMSSVLATINREYAFDDAVLPDGAELALFPPVSGG
jgi:molybdopterin converting factor subunit 1